MKKSIFDYTCEGKKSLEVASPDDEVYVSNGKVVHGDVDKQAGKDADRNDSHGDWEVDAPTDDDLLEDLDMEHADHNKRQLVLKLKTKRPFFIQGRAGWGKTSVIVKLAKKFNRSVITVYLDKAEATDLGGMPVPVRDEKTGAVSIKTAMPGWAAIMYKHPEKQYLLFFDEMNHAPSDVLHTLMPIVKDHVICGQQFNNFIVGAAGNLQEEDDLEELPGPLADRFKPIIKWESNTADTWASAFKHLHKVWDKRVGEDLVNACERVCILFENPRDVEGNILQFAEELVKEGDNEWMTVEDVKEQIEGLLMEEREGVSHYDERMKNVKVDELAQYIHTYIQSGGKSAASRPQGRMAKSKGGSNSKMNGTIDEKTLEEIKDSLTTGWVRFEGKKYGVSLENISSIAVNPDESPLTQQQITWLKNNLNILGITPRFKTNAEFIAKGYLTE